MSAGEPRHPFSETMIKSHLNLYFRMSGGVNTWHQQRVFIRSTCSLPVSRFRRVHSASAWRQCRTRVRSARLVAASRPTASALKTMPTSASIPTALEKANSISVSSVPVIHLLSDIGTLVKFHLIEDTILILWICWYVYSLIVFKLNYPFLIHQAAKAKAYRKWTVYST